MKSLQENWEEVKFLQKFTKKFMKKKREEKKVKEFKRELKLLYRTVSFEFSFAPKCWA